MKLTIRVELIAAMVILFTLSACIFTVGYYNMSNADRISDEIISRINQGPAGQSEIEALYAERDSSRTYGLLRMIVLLAAAGVLALGTAIIASRSLDREYQTLRTALARMASGDLTQRISSKSDGESGKMASLYNEIQQRFSNLVNHIKSGTAQIGPASERLAAAARQSGEFILHVSAGSQQMAADTQSQSVNTRDTAQAVGDLSGIIRLVSTAAEEQTMGVKKAADAIASVSQTLSQVTKNADVAAQGAKQATELTLVVVEKNKQNLTGIEKIKESTNDAARKIEELGNRSKEIGSIVAVIDDIASQTNLLALNAAIESARAGEHGAGFAVVSDEVRKLSERTAIATQNIADLISSVQKDIREAAEVMAGGNQAISEGYEIVTQSGQSLERIRRVASGINLQMEQISTKTQQVYTAAGEAVKLMGNIGRISEQTAEATLALSRAAGKVSSSVESAAGIAGQNSAAIQQVSSSAQEMSSQMQELESNSLVLKSLVDELASSVSGYKTG
jgi:methyl-accepting chemotaxis protein